ncbi:MAG TPA: LacI family DNA-binding transcriptional regulator [Clostridia bacterium]|nr:LacI family DNA-binding transcriptional regulator [Clostridia bacterium]
MANIREVAQEAGVSITTVSKILSGDTGFKTTLQTRQNVEAAAARLGYIRKPARRRQERIKLGCILALTAEKYSDPFFMAILAAAEEECDRQGAVISIVRNYNELKNPTVLEELYNAGLSGVFLMERVPKDILDHIRANIPNVVFIDNDEADYQFDGVGFDHVEANWKVMRCLLDHGYKRIAIISGSSPNEPFSDSFRLVTYREALRRAELTYDESLVKDCAWDLNLCAVQTRELMSLSTPPDAIFAGSDSLASAVFGTLYAMGLRCPENVGVIGFNNISLSAHMAPPLTTIGIPTHEIGVAAVQRLMDMINGRGGCKRKILFPTELILRTSLRRNEK